MTDVIQFLESMGRDAALAQATPQAYAARVAALDIAPAAQAALVSRDVGELGRVFGRPEKTYCFIVVPEADGAIHLN